MNDECDETTTVKRFFLVCGCYHLKWLRRNMTRTSRATDFDDVAPLSSTFCAYLLLVGLILSSGWLEESGFKVGEEVK
jgi:hypothetical protein